MLPNLITATRLGLAGAVMVILAVSSSPAAAWIALGVFLVAAWSDALDGYLARRLNCVSTVGAFLDPLVDKILAGVLLVFLAAHHPEWVNPWLVILLLAREFAVQGFRSIAPCKGVLIRTGTVSKLKFVFQCACIGITLLGLAWTDAVTFLRPLAWIGLALALVCGYVSMVLIFWKNRDLWHRPRIAMEIR